MLSNLVAFVVISSINLLLALLGSVSQLQLFLNTNHLQMFIKFVLLWHLLFDRKLCYLLFAIGDNVTILLFGKFRRHNSVYIYSILVCLCRFCRWRGVSWATTVWKLCCWFFQSNRWYAMYCCMGSAVGSRRGINFQLFQQIQWENGLCLREETNGTNTEDWTMGYAV